jgi:predicted transcriptional regulator
MGQDAIYNLLSRSKKPLTEHQIAKKLDRSASTINHAINRLLKYKEIKFRITKIPIEQRKKKAGNFVVRVFYV